MEEATPPSLLELNDEAFVAAWGGMEIEERQAFPPDVQAKARTRYGKIMGRPSLSIAASNPRPTQKPASTVEPLPGFLAQAVWDTYQAPPYLVKRVLGPGEVTVLFGASMHFKSVIAVDLALCVGTGVQFHKMKTRKAGVLYVAGEGNIGIKKRMRAWMMERGMTSADAQPAVYVTSVGANLMGAPEVVRATADAAELAVGMPIELVIIDTLAANFGPGDENHASEMQLAIHAARTAAPQAAVLLVHHIGHGQDERERGSYALIAAADYRLKSSYDDVSKSIELQWLKVKDDEMPAPIGFGYKVVPIEWFDEDEEEMTSVVLERLPDSGKKPVRAHGLGGNQELAMRVLRLHLGKIRKNLDDRGDHAQTAVMLISAWRAALEAKKVDRRRFPEIQQALIERGVIEIEGPHVWLKEL